MTVRAVIFDCDGVLFDSDEANVAFYNEVLARLGEPDLDPAGRVACQSFASAALFEQLFADRPALVARARSMAQEVDYGPFFDLMTPRRGLYEVLGELGRDYRLAMATNRGKTTSVVLHRFGLEKYVEFAVGALDVRRPKPDPDMLSLSLDRLGVAAAEAIYVGDQRSDAEAASAAGMKFVAMGGEIVDAEYRIDQLVDLPPLLLAM
jgi:phosphoglycolate phosphatase